MYFISVFKFSWFFNSLEELTYDLTQDTNIYKIPVDYAENMS